MSSSFSKKRPRSEDEAVLEKLLAQNEAAIQSLQSSTSSSSPQAACSSLLELKSIQSSVLAKLKQASTALEETRSQLHKQSVVLESLDYEETHLQHQLDAHLPTPHLERMCREETQQTADANVDEVMNEFLCGNKTSSYQDSCNYQHVITKLHQEINLRGSLERDAIQANKALATKTASLKQNQDFIANLPKKLLHLEKASLPLQSFFQSNTTSSMVSTERTRRLQLAKFLSGPLYTLWVQLQSYLDSSKEQQDVTVEVFTHKVLPPEDKDATTAAWFQPDPHVVHLDMSTTLVDAKRKMVTIEFAYLPKLQIVTARASSSGGATRPDTIMEALLVNLFEGDKGNMVWSADSVHLKNAASTFMSGRPYHWCNYLAGIHLPTTHRAADKKDGLDPISTKSIVTQLLRRLDANATLTTILAALKKKPNSIPTHASWKDPSANPSAAPVTTKLVGWTLVEDEEEDQHKKDDFVKTFAATLKHKTHKIKATVTIDYSRYPSVPPKWSLTSGGESWGEEHGSTGALEDATNPLYDNVLGQMERTINMQLEDLVNSKEQETYNWILAHQLHRLVCLWDEAQRAETASDAGQVPRSIKGKDRVPMES